jgi:hypothetical protein
MRNPRRLTQSGFIPTTWVGAGATGLALFVGCVIGPALLVRDHDRPYRGIFVNAICAVLVAHGVYAWVSRGRQSTP